MTSGTATRRNNEHRRQVAAQAQQRKARRRNAAITAVIGLAVVGIVTAMMVTSRSTESASVKTAPDFTLKTTSGTSVHLADYRGKNVLLYFSEGAGCGSCLMQMNAIEKQKPAFDKAGITVLPIVMNTREQILGDMHTYGTRTPFLLDDGSVSRAYKTIGHGMHAGLPGHSFVLIDKTGRQRWYGEYPSMWLAPNDLLKHVEQHLTAA